MSNDEGAAGEECCGSDHAELPAAPLEAPVVFDESTEEKEENTGNQMEDMVASSPAVCASESSVTPESVFILTSAAANSEESVVPSPCGFEVVSDIPSLTNAAWHELGGLE